MNKETTDQRLDNNKTVSTWEMYEYLGISLKKEKTEIKSKIVMHKRMKIPLMEYLESQK